MAHKKYMTTRNQCFEYNKQLFGREEYQAQQFLFHYSIANKNWEILFDHVNKYGRTINAIYLQNRRAISYRKPVTTLYLKSNTNTALIVLSLDKIGKKSSLLFQPVKAQSEMSYQ